MSTTIAPNPAPAPVPTDNDAFKDLRLGAAGVLSAASVLLLGVALYFTVNARVLASTEEDVVETWSAGFGKRTIWPVAVWSGLLGVISLGGSFLLRAQPA